MKSKELLVTVQQATILDKLAKKNVFCEQKAQKNSHGYKILPPSSKKARQEDIVEAL